MVSIPREGPSSVFDAAWPDERQQQVVPEDSVMHLEPNGSLTGKLKIARGAFLGGVAGATELALIGISSFGPIRRVMQTTAVYEHERAIDESQR